MTTIHDVRADLAAEQESLDAIVSSLTDAQWSLATPSPRWSVADQVAHLAYFDATAAQAITDPDGFAERVREVTAPGVDVDALTLARHLDHGGQLARWRANRDALAAAAERLEDSTRVVWYGPSMGAKSFLTARLMECWAHGQDIIDTVGAERAPTDRLAHITQLGFITRGWTYANRRLDKPAREVRVELESPGGGTWTYGPERSDDVDLVTGTALDFCLVVTQRRHVDDTALSVSGTGARDWLTKAQAFAGPPTDGPAAGGGRS